MKQRIWELDVFRGICILGVIVVHLIYDLVELFGIVKINYSQGFVFLMQWGGILFVVLSGLCATLGSRSAKRGLIVLGCGLVVSLVTLFMVARMGYHRSMIIYFGVLHCLGVCMLLWPLMKKLPVWALGVLGIAIIAAGFYLDSHVLLREKNLLLVPLGLRYPGFTTSDYFPLFPHLGFFLLGAVLGKTLYRKKESLLPKLNPKIFPLSFFAWCGRSSLLLYMLHQPVISGLLTLYTMLT